MKNDPIIITRNQIGQWGSTIGGVGLLLGLLGWLWQGSITPIIAGLLVAGVLGIGLWVLMAPQEFKDFISGRQTRYSTMAVFSTLLLIGIVALVYIILQRATLTLDMTLAQRFTLSSESLEILQGVNSDIRITGFYTSRALAAREIDDQFFRLYETATNGRISRLYINPDEEPALAQRFGIYSDGSVFLSYLKPDGSVDFESLARVPRNSGGAQEREMTQAIARLLLSNTIKVYFDIGQGELDPLDSTQQGLSGIHAGMQESGLITESLSIAGLAATGGSIPEDASAIIMARPTTDLGSTEIAILDAYLKRGGSLFLMADVLFNENAFLTENSIFNAYLWDNYGIRGQQAVIVDFGASLQTPLDIIGAAVFTETDIAARLDPASAPTLFRTARAIDVQTDNPPVNNGVVMLSSENSYGETNLRALAETNTYEANENEDIPGPLPIAAWAWDQTTGAKILLVGDSDYVTNGFVTSALGNAVLFTDGLSWMTGLTEQISFAPAGFSTGLPLIFISAQQLDLIALVTVILMPGFMIVLGLVIWTRRVRR
jgi:ABC-type uncharacterized transport system involved in gliding motility auxiliary subunit